MGKKSGNWLARASVRSPSHATLIFKLPRLRYATSFQAARGPRAKTETLTWRIQGTPSFAWEVGKGRECALERVTRPATGRRDRRPYLRNPLTTAERSIGSEGYNGDSSSSCSRCGWCMNLASRKRFASS
jgi:hypothetical protein